MNRFLQRIFPVVLLSALIAGGAFPAAAQAPTDSLLLHLPFDGNANDASGNNNNATVFNAVLDTNRFGEPNSSYRFNGVDSYIEIPPSPSMNKVQTSDVVSISAWININAWHASGNVFSVFERYNPSTDAGWLFEANWAGGGIVWLADETNANNYAGCNFTWNFHQWYFVCLTYDQAGDTAHYYVDGVHVCATPYAAPINVLDTTTSFVVGRSLAGPDEYSDGWIDDLRVYNRVLTSQEVGNIFTSTKPLARVHNVSVFPNPTSGFIKLQPSSSLGDKQFVLTDLLGRTMLNETLSAGFDRIDVRTLPPGMYAFCLLDANGVTKGTVVIE